MKVFDSSRRSVFLCVISEVVLNTSASYTIPSRDDHRMSSSSPGSLFLYWGYRMQLFTRSLFCYFRIEFYNFYRPEMGNLRSSFPYWSVLDWSVLDKPFKQPKSRVCQVNCYLSEVLFFFFPQFHGRLLEEGNVDGAEVQKQRIEQLQRERKKVLQDNNMTHKPRFFKYVNVAAE